jgi:hypothetical protein
MSNGRRSSGKPSSLGLDLSYESGPTANAFRRRPSAGEPPTPQLQNPPFWRMAFPGKPSSHIEFELREWANC